MGACGGHSSAEHTSEPASPTLNGGIVDADSDGTASTDDCDDHNAAVWRMVGVFVDSDGDGLGSGPAVIRCVGDAPPAGTSFVSGDCDDDSPTLFANLPFAARDEDLDGYVVAASGTICTNGSLPPGYLANADATSIDCDDHDPSRWRMITVYRDNDNDTVGSGPGEIRCLGSFAPAGFSFLGYDPNDSPTDPGAAGVSEPELDVSILVVPQSADDDAILIP